MLLSFFLNRVLDALGWLYFLEKDIFKYLNINLFLLLLSCLIIVLLILVIKKTKISGFHVHIKKHSHFIKITIFTLGIVVISKCFSLIQLSIYIIEFGAIYLLIEYELNKFFENPLTISETSDSNFIEKPIVGEKNLTLNQRSVLNQLIELVDHRKSTDSFNIGLIGEWGSGKTSITDTLIYELENRNSNKKYFFLKINVMTLNKSRIDFLKFYSVYCIYDFY